MVNVLVIGAAGYIGEPLALELRRQGHKVYGLVRNIEKANDLVKGEVIVVVGDSTKAEALVEVMKKVDVVVSTVLDFSNTTLDIDSLAALSSAIDQAGGSKKKVVFLTGLLGFEPSDAPLTEISPILSEESLQSPAFSATPFFIPYFRNRLETEKRILASQKFSGVIANIPMIYGKSTKAHWTIHFKHAEEGKIVSYGDGSLVISFLHIDDCVDGIIKLINAETSKVEHQVFLFAEPGLSQRDIAHALAKGTGKQNLTEENAPFPAPFYGRGHLHVDPSKAKQVLGWTATHDLARDANELYASWKAYGSIPNW